MLSPSLRVTRHASRFTFVTFVARKNRKNSSNRCWIRRREAQIDEFLQKNVFFAKNICTKQIYSLYLPVILVLHIRLSDQSRCRTAPRPARFFECGLSICHSPLGLFQGQTAATDCRRSLDFWGLLACRKKGLSNLLSVVVFCTNSDFSVLHL